MNLEEVDGLRVAHQGSVARLTWDELGARPVDLTFQVLGGDLAEMHGLLPAPLDAWRGLDGSECLGSPIGALQWDDGRAPPSSALALGFWYLVRARAQCGGVGTYGFGSRGERLPNPAEDCSP